MQHRRRLLQASTTLIAGLAAISLGAGTAEGSAHSLGVPNVSHIKQLTRPAHKYYGVYVAHAPNSMAPIQAVTRETGKAPNMSLSYDDWSTAPSGRTNISATAVQNACDAGMLPMLTWESWDTSQRDSAGRVDVSQPKFSPRSITSGRYDAYIRSTAEMLKNINCPIALRLDQEVNSNWYPWAINTPGMSNTAARYVAMWRHVWDIFQKVQADNVLWVWSPNIQSLKHRGLPSLSASYPGKKYVDWVGVDGYFYNNPTATFYTLFQPTFTQLHRFARNKPWIVAEAGVGSGASKARQITSLVRAVARRKRLSGLNYFDLNKSTDRSNWRFDETGSDLQAFRSAISSSVFGSAVAGETP